MMTILRIGLVILTSVLQAFGGPNGSEAKQSPPSPATTDSFSHYLIRCGHAIDPKSGRVQKDIGIEINQGKIVSTRPWESIKSPKAIKVINAQGKFVLPGLIDTHAHLYGGVGRQSKDRQNCNPSVPPMLLAAGVTSAGVPGAMDPVADRALRAQIERGEILGPRLFLAGRYFEGPQGEIPWMQFVRSLDEALALVDAEHAAGAAAIKIYNHFPAEWLQATTRRAHQHGMKVWAHLGEVTYAQAMSMGVDHIHHGIRYMKEARSDKTSAGSQEAPYFRDSNDLMVVGVLKMASNEGTVLTPTLGVGLLSTPGFTTGSDLALQKPYFTQEAWERISEWNVHGLPGLDQAKVKAAHLAQQAFVRRAQAEGCLLAAGTDVLIFRQLPGHSLWHELELMAEAGLSPMEVLRAATWHGAIAMGAEKELGSIEAGKLADLIILDKDPLAQISHIRTVRTVIKGGKPLVPDEIRRPWIGRVH